MTFQPLPSFVVLVSFINQHPLYRLRTSAGFALVSSA